VLTAMSLPLLVELALLSVAAGMPSRRFSVSSDSEMQMLRLAVIVPAHNEEKVIGECVRSVLASSNDSVALFVVAHNCSDKTAEVAEKAGAQAIVLNDEVGGKGVALDFGFHKALSAGADAVLVGDADSVVAPNLTTAIAARFLAGAQALQCRYEVSNDSASTRTKLATLAFLGMNVLRPKGRDRLGLSCGIFGNGFALSADALERVPYTANSLVEDLEYHLHLIRAGIRVEFVNESAVFGEMPEGSAAATTQRARWEGGRILMRRLWTGPLLREVTRGKLKMLEPLLDLLAVPLATEGMILTGALALGLLARLTWLSSYAAVGIGVMVLYVVVAASLGPDPGDSLRAIASVPGYIAWKIWMIPRTRMASRRDATWVRTKRNSEDL
jgi:cellulose synthase/poly-beta-1,6-N-acetylglucosamine synthase-like glycosyltransferase